MDLCADMLLERLARHHADQFAAARVCPSFRRVWGRLPVAGRTRQAFNADRLLNRFLMYPAHLSNQRDQFDLFHVIDHSYAQLVHRLPARRTIVTCNDLDAFQCLLVPHPERRPLWFRGMARRILSGLQKAACVTCISEATRQALVDHQLVPAQRTVTIHLGVDPLFTANADMAADQQAAALLGPARRDAIEILHVGSTIGRKRIDTLLHAFAEVRKQHPGARLVRAGGPFQDEQSALVRRLQLQDAIVVLPVLPRAVLAAVYRRAALVLLPSEREGFGLPVVEAMACGVLVVASNLDVLREVGGEAAMYCPVGDAPEWARAINPLLIERRDHADAWTLRRLAALARAAEFSWEAYARRMTEVYIDVLRSAGRETAGIK